VGEYVSAVSENALQCQGNNRFHAVQCSSATGLLDNSPQVCDARAFDGGDSREPRAADTSRDWDYGAFKGECGLGQFVAGVSVDPATGRPHSLLCCNR
jgi:hypothetical protein